MKIMACLATVALALTASAARAEPIAWRIVGSNPDVYAPVYPQPSGHDYFAQAQSRASGFLHPAFAPSFAQLRRSERDEARSSARQARSTSGFSLALATSPAPHVH